MSEAAHAADVVELRSGSFLAFCSCGWEETKSDDGDARDVAWTHQLDHSPSYSLGRSLTFDQALAIAREATFDPGRFTRRLSWNELELETVERWQARAVLVALAGDQGEILAPRVSDDERAEMHRVGLSPRAEQSGSDDGASL